MQKDLTGLKKTVFYEMLELAGRVFIAVRYSENVVIGTRGFTEDEIKNGLVLVFNKMMHFSWDDSGISASLVFGSSPQKCLIPSDDIMVIYSPELNSQLIAAAQDSTANPDIENKDKELESRESCMPHDSNVVRVDFKKKKAGHAGDHR